MKQIRAFAFARERNNVGSARTIHRVRPAARLRAAPYPVARGAALCAPNRGARFAVFRPPLEAPGRVWTRRTPSTLGPPCFGPRLPDFEACTAPCPAQDRKTRARKSEKERERARKSGRPKARLEPGPWPCPSPCTPWSRSGRPLHPPPAQPTRPAAGKRAHGWGWVGVCGGEGGCDEPAAVRYAVG